MTKNLSQSHAHSPESLRCASAKPNRLIETSTAVGWTSLLLDHHEGAGNGEYFETHPTDDLTLVVAIAGRHKLNTISHGRWRSAIYQPGTAGMTPRGHTARLRWQTPAADQSFRSVHLYLPQSLLCSVADEYRQIGQTVAENELAALAFRDESVTSQAGALLAACRDGAPDLYAAGAARWLLTHLLSRQAKWHHVVDDTRIAAAITDRRLARVIEYMSANLDRALTLEQLASEAGISVHHFGRRFQESTGMGPATYLTMLRIAQARLLLCTTDIAVAEVGRQCGYANASAFATAFLRQVGTTPSRCRARG